MRFIVFLLSVGGECGDYFRSGGRPAKILDQRRFDRRQDRFIGFDGAP
ncbi:MAG TPA: hypothetical protein VFH22_04855 [Rhodocyclaceae bacterium]|nr:hypothetical protein [Rhodocyclaceae bacterium]